MISMSQSPLVNYEAYTTYNCNAPRSKKISKITVHHAAGVMSVEGMKNIIHNPNREVSCNYAIGYDARVGGYIREENRAWTSSSWDNDQQAITIEVSNSACSSDWPVSDKVWAKLVDLCADICKRNGIPKLTYTGTPSGTLTFHCMFTSTACPGPYIKSRAQLLCNQVNAKLNGSTAPEVKPTDPKTDATATVDVKVGDVVSIKSDAVYWSGTSIPGWVKNLKWKISDLKNNRAILGASEDGVYNIQSPIDCKYLTVVKKEEPKPAAISEQVKIPAGTPIYYMNCKDRCNTINLAGTYTIIEKKTVDNNSFGKLKSGAGWVNLTALSKPAEKVEIKPGDTVEVLNNVQYNGKVFTQYQKEYKVLEVSGDRLVISSDGKNVTCAINVSNTRKV